MPIRVLKQRPRVPRTMANVFAPIPSGEPEKLKVANLAIYAPDPTVPNAFTALEAALNYKYANSVELQNHVIVLCYNDGIEFTDFKKKHPFKKIIVYQLEQISSKGNLWWDDASKNQTVKDRTARIKQWLTGCDVIWEYDLANMDFLQSKGFGNKTVFKPLEYSEANVYDLPEEEKIYDVIFFGSVNPKRLEFLKAVNKEFNLCCVGVYQNEDKAAVEKSGVKVIPAVHGKNLWNYINKAKVVLNLHYYDGIQEQVRLVDLLCNNKCIVSQKSNWNYFGDLISEFETPKEMIEQIEAVLQADTDKIGKDTTANFKNRNYKQYKVGAVYNSFYDLELLETSIKSIRRAVDYIVVVHQPVSFKGEPCVKNYNDILAGLVRKGLVDDVMIYTHQRSVIDKRNIGLDMCKEKGCNYIMPLDNDECYNSHELRKEIDYMFNHNIHTLYSKILSYYQDSFHYFTDTYYVPSVYKIDERQFELAQSHLLCDPDRKMKEKTFRLSEMAMHHLTYLPAKIANTQISNPRNEYEHIRMEKIRAHFNSWKEGVKALVFANDFTNGGLVIAKEVELTKTDKQLF